MGTADIQYINLVKDILENGYYDNNRTGIPTKKLFGKLFEFNLQKEFPILTTKFIAFKTAIKELLWIYVKGSNDVRELQKENVHIWDEWMKPDGTIGKAYGYQARQLIDRNSNKIDQVENLINGLKNNPQSRRYIINLWNVQDLKEMALEPCCFMTMWDVSDGYLNCTLIQRSSDVPLGVPFNTCQYATLVHMVAHITELKVGKFIHFMNNAHIYENQIEAINTQLDRVPYKQPKIWINPEVRNFNDFTIDDIKLSDYKYHPKIEMEVAV
jgi:thymidylate synthase